MAKSKEPEYAEARIAEIRNQIAPLNTELKVFAAAIAEEREACAALCEHLSLDGLSGHEYADAIRKRSNVDLSVEGKRSLTDSAGTQG